MRSTLDRHSSFTEPGDAEAFKVKTGQLSGKVAVALHSDGGASGPVASPHAVRHSRRDGLLYEPQCA